jgi:hypothetical protein
MRYYFIMLDSRLSLLGPRASWAFLKVVRFYNKVESNKLISMTPQLALSLSFLLMLEKGPCSLHLDYSLCAWVTLDVWRVKMYK